MSESRNGKRHGMFPKHGDLPEGSVSIGDDEDDSAGRSADGIRRPSDLKTPLRKNVIFLGK